jgi:hypothetical protein
MHVWKCHHVSLVSITAPPLRSTSTIPVLLESVDGGTEKGRNVYGKFPGPLGQQQAGFSGQRVGYRPSVELPVRCGGRVMRGACVLNLAAAEWLPSMLVEERSRGWSE